MNMQDILNAAAAGNFTVEVNHDIQHATSRIGTVQEIRIFGEKNKEVGVFFPGTKWNTWFHESDETDKRKHYMRDLTSKHQYEK